MTVRSDDATESPRSLAEARDELARSARMLWRWAPELFPAGADGRLPMARAMMESAAKAIDDYRAMAEADLGAKIDAIATELRRIGAEADRDRTRPL